jgi:hypothetical protein
MGPTYRAGLMRHWALEKMRALELEHGAASVFFENLGPPRLSKRCCTRPTCCAWLGTMDKVRAACRARAVDRAWLPPRIGREPAVAARDRLHRNPALLPDGRPLRGPSARSRPSARAVCQVTHERVDAWAHAGWVDLREPNMTRWARPEDPRRDHAIPSADSRRASCATASSGAPRTHPAGQAGGLDLRHRGAGREDEMSEDPARAGVRRVLTTLALNAGQRGKIVVGKPSGSLAMVADGFHSLVDGSITWPDCCDRPPTRRPTKGIPTGTASSRPRPGRWCSDWACWGRLSRRPVGVPRRGIRRRPGGRAQLGGGCAGTLSVNFAVARYEGAKDGGWAARSAGSAAHTCPTST